MTAAEQKAALRQEAAGLPKVDAPELVERFLSLPQTRQAGTVMIFCGVGRELDTMPIFERLLARGTRVAFPVCLPGRKMEARLVSSPQQLVPGAYHIPAPDENCPAVEKKDIDLILVPCSLCDRDGYRLGWGGGYYDRYLADFAGATVCICPGERLRERLPRDEFDIPVQLVLTDG